MVQILSRRMVTATSKVLPFSSILFCTLVAACSGSDSSTCSSPGGPVAGDQDNHCGTTVQSVNPASCSPPDEGMEPDGGANADAGTMEELPGAMSNTEADDDDCKYHVKWSVTPVCENSDVTFTLKVTRKSDHAPAAGGDPFAEVFLNDTHPAPNSDQKSTEGPPGTYKIGPVRFDASGKWTVRFHYFHECSDELEDSPHGHAAFFVNVP